MKPDLRFIETIDRLIRNIPAACTLLVEEGHTYLAGRIEECAHLAGQLERDQRNLVLWRKPLGDPLETVTCIPFPIIKFICDILMGTANVEVPWSDDPLEMAHTAIERQKLGISRVLDLITERCFTLPPAEPEEPEP